jgi:hypothetical protein
MSAYGEACCHCFEEILSIIAILGGGAAHLRFLAYGDYDTPSRVTDLSGPGRDAFRLLQATCIYGGGDVPEAVKTALTDLLDAADDSRTFPEGGQGSKHVVFLFTDAPPHTAMPALKFHKSSKGHLRKERQRLGDGFDWLVLRGRMRAQGVTIATFMPANRTAEIGHFYSALGPIIPIQDTESSCIAQTLMAAFSCLIGQPDSTTPGLEVVCSPINFDAFCTEAEIPMDVHLKPVCAASALYNSTAAALIGATLHTLPGRLQREDSYRSEVMQLLGPLLTVEHARCLMTNQMLGKIWRALSAFRRHDTAIARLCDTFGNVVQALKDDGFSAWVLSTYNRCAQMMLNPMVGAHTCLTSCVVCCFGFQLVEQASNLARLRQSMHASACAASTAPLRGH